MKLLFRFEPGVAPAERNRTLRLLRRRGATNVHRLHTGSTPVGLADIYVAEAATTPEATAYVRELGSLPGIAYAEVEARRRPSRPPPPRG